MKKQILVAAFAAITGLVSAQSSFTITDPVLGVVNGTTINYWVSTSVTDTRHADFLNTSESNLNVKVRKSVLQLNDAGATVWFCTDQSCYAPATVLSPAFAMGPSTTFDLTYDFNPNNATGVTQVRYSVINQANPADSAWFVVVYNLSNSPTGVVNTTVAKPSVSNPMPNPASTVFSMNYKLGSASSSNAKIVVYNMLGSVVMENPVADADGVVKMDVSTLEQGIYFCTLESDGKALATRRLVVSH